MLSLVSIAAVTMLSDAEIEALPSSERVALEEAEEDMLRNSGESGAMAGPRLVEGGWDYCNSMLCNYGEGDCDKSSECSAGLYCGHNNCLKMNPDRSYQLLVDCCGSLDMFHWEYCKYEQCDHGNGDCDSHEQCGAGLKCGVNNCKAMHPELADIQPEADCCTRCSEVKVGPEGMRTSVEAQYWGPLVVGPHRTVTSLPASLQETAVYNLRELDSDDTIKLKCCPWKGEDCQFFISVFHCKPCSEELNGGLPEYLLSNGWDAGACAPTFTTSIDQGKHAMITYHRAFNPGEVAIIPITKHAPHVIVNELAGSLTAPWCYKQKGPVDQVAHPCDCIQLPSKH